VTEQGLAFQRTTTVSWMALLGTPAKLVCAEPDDARVVQTGIPQQRLAGGQLLEV
jgi:hypothetical protein